MCRFLNLKTKISNKAFKSSPEEIRRRKILKKGIQFTLLICGEEGTGKTSFINTLCNQEVLSKKGVGSMDPERAHANTGMTIYTKQVNITEKDSTPISLELILTPGYGDNVNNEECTGKLIQYLEKQFDDVLNEECRIKRNPKFKDGRPHACLYFIRATSKGLRELDVEAMKSLSTRVNVIPVISKSDTLTEDELALNKALVLQGLKANGITVYDFSVGVEDDTDSIDDLLFLKNNLPFAISGGYEKIPNNIAEEGTETLSHVREYPWGTFKVEDLNHSDFNYIKNVLFGSHLQELKDSTHLILYENYRRERLTENGNYKVSSKSATGEETSLLDRYNYVDQVPPLVDSEPDVLHEGDMLREIMEKKKAIEDYSNELRLLEKKLHASSITSMKHSKVIGSDISTTYSYNA